MVAVRFFARKPFKLNQVEHVFNGINLAFGVGLATLQVHMNQKNKAEQKKNDQTEQLSPCRPNR